MKLLKPLGVNTQIEDKKKLRVNYKTVVLSLKILERAEDN